MHNVEGSLEQKRCAVRRQPGMEKVSLIALKGAGTEKVCGMEGGLEQKCVDWKRD